MKDECSPEEIALKASFLGPQAENAKWIQSEMTKVLERWFVWRRSFAPIDGDAISTENQKSKLFLQRQIDYDKSLQELMTRFEKELPKFSPRYVGHMFSEISLPALLGHFITLLHNPNNISREASRVGVELEREAILALAKMVGYPETTVGHFTSGGTVANFEALSRAKQRAGLWMSIGDKNYFNSAHQGWEKFWKKYREQQNPKISNLDDMNFAVSSPWILASKLKNKFGKDFLGPVILVPENKHYSWTKSVSLLGLGKEAFWPVDLDSSAHLNVSDLKSKIEKAALEDRPILSVVSVAGTTELANIDPIHRVADLLEEIRTQNNWHIWHHVDAAYGGFFASLLRTTGASFETVLSENSVSALRALPRSDSITIDPHKLGYVPYASGAILIREMANDHLRDESAPYIDFDPVLDRGPYTIEGSRSAAGAAATWMIDKCVGLNADGYGRILERTLMIKNELAQNLVESKLPIVLFPQLDTNIICFHVKAESVSKGNQKTKALYQKMNELSDQRGQNFIVSKTKLNASSYKNSLQLMYKDWNPTQDEDGLVLLRITLMNPFLKTKEMKAHFLDELVENLQQKLI